MKTNHSFQTAWLVTLLAWACVPAACVAQVSLELNRTNRSVNLSWPSRVLDWQASVVYPEYTVQSSGDLVHWQPIGGKVRGLSGRSGPLLNLSLDATPGTRFYRVLADPSSQTPNETGDGGAEVFGYNARFAEELGRVGLLSVAAFASSAPPPPYLPQLSWDPTTAQFWTNFSRVCRLNSSELAIFEPNGFVVSERMGFPSFGQAYYGLFNSELPVFITADSILHAWHRSYQSMLQGLEEGQLSGLLGQLLTNMAVQLPQVWQQYGHGPLSNSILDADYFLTVARSLWAGQQVPSSVGAAGQDQLVGTTLTAVTGLSLQWFPLFGSTRMVDFSQFKVRGHYDSSETLRRYFRTMMWCGRIDLRLAAFAPNKEDDIRQLGTAVVLNHLLRQSGQFANWSAIEQIIRVFVGVTDSMTFAQLADLLAAANIQSLADVPDLLTLTNLQTRLLTGELGVQSITGDVFFSPLSREQVRLPRSFTVCGQKFVMDSWAFSQVTYDRIVWSPAAGITVKVNRRKPSCLDVAFSVLGNDQTVPDLVARMTTTNGVPFRDGLPYQHNLTAVRNVIDSQDARIWTDNIYNAWLAALRALSAPTTDAKYPEAMRTRAWAMKTLNTQLASWTELRHDTLLYVKQSYSDPVLCGYPDGFVEPRPEFWQRMHDLAEITALAIAGSPVNTGTQLNFLHAFADTMLTLQGIAEKELAQEPLSATESVFLQNVVEVFVDYMGVQQWTGWYPGLFYGEFAGARGETPGCALWDPLVADVHTDVPDEVSGDPGAVIHEAVGNVHLLMIAVDNGPDRMVYAGPVFSHYEFEVPGVTRLSDDDWKTRLQAGQKPPSPEWTRSYLVPSP